MRARQEDQLFALLDDLTTVPVSFLNLNELEITVGNQENMDVRGFNLSGGITAAAEGSAELAIRLKEAAADKPYHLKFCTAKFKDAGQLRNRFKRRGQVTLRLLTRCSATTTPCCSGPSPPRSRMLVRTWPSCVRNWAWPRAGFATMLLISVLNSPSLWREELAEVLEAPVMLVEVHPTHERLEVGVVHLNDHR